MLNSLQSLNAAVSDSIETIEEILGQFCDRLHRLAIVFTELAQSAIPPGPPSDTLVKVLYINTLSVHVHELLFV